MTQKSEFDLLIKLLKMTRSVNDQEALAFLRKANQQLDKQGWDWEKLLYAKVKIVADPFGDLKGPIAPPPPPQPFYQQPPQPAAWQASRQPDPDPAPNYRPQAAGTRTGRSSFQDPYLKPRQQQPRRRSSSRVAPGNITLDDLGL